MNLSNYVEEKYKNKKGWFIEEVSKVTNQHRLSRVNANKDYLAGIHDITNAPAFTHNGVLVEPRKIVINLAKQLISWQTSFLLRNNIMVVGNERVADMFNEVNKRGKYNLHNNTILKMMLCYGECAEYVYMENGSIKSKIISPSNYTPIFNRHNELMALIEHYSYDNVNYYTVYDDEKVQEYHSKGNKIELIAQYPSLTGLPILYNTNSYGESGTGNKSDLEDWKGILDNMEQLISKYTDSLYVFLNPIPIQIGQELKNSMNKDVVGQGITLDDGSDFKLVQARLDNQSFNSLYKTLNQTLLDVSATPAVAMGRAEISNVSETSIKLMFSLAEVRGHENEIAMKHGLYERNEKIKVLLSYKGFTMTEDEFYSLDFVFSYNIPMNDKEVIDNLKVLREINVMSIESMLEKNPYVEDIQMEKERLIQEGLLDSSQVD